MLVLKLLNFESQVSCLLSKNNMILGCLDALNLKASCTLFPTDLLAFNQVKIAQKLTLELKFPLFR